MATEIWVGIGSCNEMLPNGTKPLPKPELTNYQILCYSVEDNFTGNAQDIYHWYMFENYDHARISHAPMG